MKRLYRWLATGSIAVLTQAAWAASTQPADEFRGTPVSVHANGARLSDVVADLARQAGVSIEVAPYIPPSVKYLSGIPHGPWPAVTLDLDRVPFWQALADLCDLAGATVVRTYGPKIGLSIRRGVLRRDIHGAIMVTAGRFDQRTGNLLVTCLWDPGLDVVVRDTWLAPAITAPDGRSLVTHPWPPPPDPMENQNFVREVGWGNRVGFGTRVPLVTWPADDEPGNASYRRSFGTRVTQTTAPAGVRSVRVSGTVRLWVATKWETITMPCSQPKPNGPPTLQRLSDGHSVNVWLEYTGNPAANIDGMVVRLDLSRSNPDNSILYESEWLPYRHLLAAGKVTVADAQGRPYYGPGETDGKDDAQGDQVASGQWTLDGRDSSTVRNEYDRLPGQGPPATLSVHVPSAWTEIDVPYLLPDVPLGEPAVDPASDPRTAQAVPGR